MVLTFFRCHTSKYWLPTSAGPRCGFVAVPFILLLVRSSPAPYTITYYIHTNATNLIVSINIDRTHLFARFGGAHRVRQCARGARGRALGLACGASRADTRHTVPTLRRPVGTQGPRPLFIPQAPQAHQAHISSRGRAEPRGSTTRVLPLSGARNHIHARPAPACLIRSRQNCFGVWPQQEQRGPPQQRAAACGQAFSSV